MHIAMKLLLIAGMGESVDLAQSLSTLPGIEVVAVTEGRAVARAKPPVRVHEGGFHDDRAFADFLRQEAFDLVIDAAHPFQFSLGRVARATGQGYLRASRDLWPENPGYILRPTLADVVACLPHDAHVFAVTGRGSLAAFENRPDVTVHCRQLTRHDDPFPLPLGGFVFGAGPFSVEDEIATFQALGITHLVLRNGGSVMGHSKLAAAARVGVQVAMITAPRWNIPADAQMSFADILKQVKSYASH
ncbi:Precorrin-6A reductase [Ascidiaceihabitans donghaensis]|uniref:Precorrin-6A reductase n=2 Tax=Ascidiaceihabitans donghaensis TaxID=1510460 RepID=A0A2R8BDZ5_9RHOB|nr:Precorrin-6A reductase [Ascidiaceihabitans donghaensis]